MTRVAVVGAGAAAAGAAYTLAATDAETVVFEARDRVGGRAASATHDGVVYDYGANYVRDTAERPATFLREAASPTDTPPPVDTFDETGTVSPGRDDDEAKWSTPEGVQALVGRLLDAADATVHTGAPVRRLVRTADGWRADADPATGRFDAVVVTPPAPTTAELLARSDWDDPAREQLVAAARDVSYATVWSAALGYDRELDRPYYALVCTADGTRASWFSRESCKPGHVPDGEVVIAQGGHEWSATHADADPAWAAGRLADAASEVIGEPWLAAPAWADAVCWEHALVEDQLLPGPRRAAAEAGLYPAGDWVAGEARVHAALASGIETGERIALGG
ncbi:NAD(P)/FAD-dependent oxidoreductase [Halobaculum sp. MBLA0143]|uniref:NAD(P)/FAD-dependent oxidoreductase n=1 Tax=Halobaculum sp. MBLA0143 TaxID=3079933 RepID=UPI003526B128